MRIWTLLLIVSVWIGCLSLGSGNATAQQPVWMMRTGVYGLAPTPDPFKWPTREAYPITTYVPPGTIVFKRTQGDLPEYYKILTHYGLWVQIPKKVNIENLSVSTLLPTSTFVQHIPTDAMVFHHSILCLAQSGQIVKLVDRI